MENFLMSKLKYIDEYKFQENILVVPSFGIGYQILDNIYTVNLDI